MAERAGNRESFFDPEKPSCESRGRVVTCTPGISVSTSFFMVEEPISNVSSRPRWFSMRSVKTWPRSRSAASWISSIATKARSRSRGMASTVQIQ